MTYEGSTSATRAPTPRQARQVCTPITIYDQPTVAGMQADITFAAQNNVGYVYVTDQPLNPPTGYLYDQLPSYWDQEVAAIAGASVPEPGSITLMVSGCIVTASGFAMRRRNACG